MECFSNSEHVKKRQNGRKMSTLDGSKFNSVSSFNFTQMWKDRRTRQMFFKRSSNLMSNIYNYELTKQVSNSNATIPKCVDIHLKLKLF